MSRRVLMQEVKAADTDRLALQEQLRSASAQHRAEIAAMQGASAALQEQLAAEQASLMRLRAEMKVLTRHSNAMKEHQKAAAIVCQQHQEEMRILQLRLDEAERVSAASQLQLCSQKALASPAMHGSTAFQQQGIVGDSDGELTPRREFANAMVGIAAAVGLHASSQPPADIPAAEEIATPERDHGAQLQDRQGDNAEAGSDDRLTEDSALAVHLTNLAKQTMGAEKSKPATLSTQVSCTFAHTSETKVATACTGSQELKSCFSSPNSRDVRTREEVRKPKSPLSGTMTGICRSMASSTPSKTPRYGKPLMMMGEARNKENSPPWKP